MKRHLLPVLLITLVSLSLYANSLKNGFVYDDKLTVVDNTFIKSLDNLPLLLDKASYFSRSGEMSYRPVVTFTYFVDYALYGLKSWGYHLTNLLLHALNGALLYVFLTFLLAPYSLPLTLCSRLLSPALIAALIFITHPALTEAVNCISYREDLLVFLFYIATFSLYMVLRKPATDRRPLTTLLLYLLSCLSLLLALLSKEMAVTLPQTIYLYELFLAKTGQGMRRFLPSLSCICYMVITLIYVYIRFYSFQNPIEIDHPDWPLSERILTIPLLVVHYVKLIIFPVVLSADYEITPVKLLYSISFIVPVVVLLLIFILSLNVRNHKVIFGILFFLTALTPALNIIPIARPFAERYAYLPIIGLVVVMEPFICFMQKTMRRYLFILLVIVLTIFALGVVKRNCVWQSQHTLWTDTVVKTPNSSTAHTNLGLIYFREGRLKEAIEELKTAIKLKPYVAEKYYALGQVYHKQGRLEEAIQEFNIAISIKPTDKRYHVSLGIAYFDQGWLANALREFETAYRIDPADPKIIQNLNVVHERLK